MDVLMLIDKDRGDIIIVGMVSAYSIRSNHPHD